MAIQVQLNDVVEVKVFCSYEEQQSVNVRHYKVTAVTAGTVTDQNLANTLGPSLSNVYLAAIHEAASYRGLTAQIIYPTARPSVFDVTGAGLGPDDNDPMPPQICGLVKLTTSLAGPGGRGRIYLPFPSIAQYGATGEWNAPYIAMMEDIVDQWLIERVITVGIGNATFTPVLYNRTAHTTTPIVDYIVRENPATQRRRSFINPGDVFQP